MMVERVRRCREFTGPTPHSVAIVSLRFFLQISEMFSTCLLSSINKPSLQTVLFILYE